VSPLQIVICALTGLGLLVWGLNLALVVTCMRRIPHLTRLGARPPSSWPAVCVVIPARNEARTLEAAVRSHLATDYPNVGFVLVDDRSNDGTGDIVDRLAAADPRVQAVHVSHLPTGWLGKVHALHVGQTQGSSDWILFTDADAHVKPDTLRRMIAWCESEGVDLVSPIARLFADNPLLDVLVGAFCRVLFTASQPWRSADPRAKQAFGLGAFILVRRAVLEKSEGLSWLKLEVADDMALAAVVKRAGGRLRVINASDCIELPLYKSFDEMRSSTEKGGYAIVGRYSVVRTVLLSLLLVGLELSPIAGFLPIGVPGLAVAAATGVVMMLVAVTAMMVWTRRAAWTGLAYPLGLVWMAGLQVRSAILCGLRGGVAWRGSVYSAQVLRAGARVTWP
jgi:glycosyltransferase involved in cell wall biosynthesis